MTGMLTNLRYRGKIYALPTSRSTPVLYYNKDRFTAAGLDPDKPPRTWEEVRDMSEALSSRDSRHYGILVLGFPRIFESLVWSAGGELIAGGKAKFAQAAQSRCSCWPIWCIETKRPDSAQPATSIASFSPAMPPWVCRIDGGASDVHFELFLQKLARPPCRTPRGLRVSFPWEARPR